MGINIGWTILFTHSISKMYPSYTRLLRNVVKSYWVTHIFHFVYVTSWIWVHSIPTIIDITTFTKFNFNLRSPSISIFQKNKCTFVISVATTFANNHIHTICATYWIRTSDWIFIRDLPYLLAKFATYPFDIWGLPLDIYLFWRQPIHHISTIVSNWNLAYLYFYIISDILSNIFCIMFL